MQQKLRVKINRTGRKRRVEIRFLVLALAMSVLGIHLPRMSVRAESCPDLRIVFARGSGAEAETSADYLEFKATLETKLETTELSYEFIDLDYPAVGVGIENLGVTLGAFFSGGEGHEFGESVNAGVRGLMELTNGTCRETKYVLGGYSQGAMVISKALESLDAGRIIYAATFGDPKIYLPEGEGLIPAACRGENLSDYRMYVPDCQAYKGLLGAYIPYEPDAYAGKLGTWCNKRDIFCSSYLNISDHVGYVTDDLYEDASRVMFDKITAEFGIENTVRVPHDTAFLIDSTGSMMGMIDKYKAEALRLAKETLENGGRVALYDYRDLWDPYTPVERCSFTTCTLEIFEKKLGEIVANNGGDVPESLLSASLLLMNEQEWNFGSTKSLVVLTDANYLSPDRDGVSFDQVVALSKAIDPVNIYIITEPWCADYYKDLALETGGRVVTDFNELSLLTDYIIERYDTLPVVEEGEAVGLPVLKVENVVWTAKNEATVEFETTGEQTIIIINDEIIGMTAETRITMNGVDRSASVILVPVAGDRRGEAVEIDLADGKGGVQIVPTMVGVPKAPNTGRA